MTILCTIRPSSSLPAAALAAALLFGAPAPAAAQLASLGSVLLDQCDGTPDPCETGDQLGRAVAAGDFDGDGYEDLAVGVPYETVAGATAAGAVHVFYGSPGGLQTTGDQLFSQSTSGVAGVVEADDLWGWSLAAGRFNTDAYDDLAIGGPGEDLTVGGDPYPDAGAVWVLFGSAAGLTGSGSLSFDQETAPISGQQIEDYDRFGEALASSPTFRSYIHDSLVIGARQEDDEGSPPSTQAGRVFVISQASGGTLNSAQVLNLQDFGCGDSTQGNFFGAALGVEYRRSGSYPSFPNVELTIGAPGRFAGAVNAGTLFVEYALGTPAGCWHQASTGILDTPETDDAFSSALALGDFDDDGDSDLAVGVPGEGLASSANGVVQVIYNDGAGLTAAGDQELDQDDFAPNDTAEAGDRFGDRLTVGDFDGDGAADLAIGVPEEDLTFLSLNRSAAGLVQVLYGTGGVGLSMTGAQTFHQAYPADMLDSPATGDRFGEALAVGDFDGNGSDDLAIGVSSENSGGTADAGAVQVLYGLDGDTGAFGTVRFLLGTLTVAEDEGLAGVAVGRAQSAVPAATVDHLRSSGSATPGADFSYTPGAVSWSAGDDAIETFSFTVLEDTLDEPNETLVLALANPTIGTALGSPATFTVTIVDNDVAGSLQFSVSSFPTMEGTGSALISVERTGGAASNVTVHYETWAAGGTATAGQDYTAVSGTLTFGAGDGGQYFTVPILNDPTDEPDETVALRLTTPGGGGSLGSPATATLLIEDDDPTGQLLRDGFASGDTSAWSQIYPEAEVRGPLGR